MSSVLHVPLIGVRDLLLLGSLGVGYAATSLVPPTLDSRLVSTALPVTRLIGRRRGTQLARRIQSLLDLPKLEDALSIAREHHRMAMELRWARLRSLHVGTWQPEIEIRGEGQLRSALAEGKGAIVWLMSFCATPVFFQGVWRAGIPLVHLSHAKHGSPSASRLGLRWTASLFQRAENPYLAERVVIPLDRSLGYMRILLDRLTRNACVSIVGENLGRRNIRTDFFNGAAEFATGAPALARKTGASLLTAYSIRLDAFRYRVVIEPPLDLDRSSGRQSFVEQAVGHYARRLEKHIGEHPANWQGWYRAGMSAP